MKFSIVIPVYNVEKKLDRCLNSLLSQDYRDYEIILVNDGSSDSSGEICKKYSEKYDFIKFINKGNGGASSARNAGLKCALGDYILFADSDDYVKDNYFTTINANVTPGGLSVLTYDVKTEKGIAKRDIQKDAENNGKSIFEKTKSLILSRTINSPCSKIFDRELILNSQLFFDEKMPVAEDFNFCLAYLMKCKNIKIINESVYIYDRTNETSLVNKQKKGLIDIYPYVFDTAYSTIENSSFTTGEKAELFRIWDKLHTDSFGTCVMEELKDSSLSEKEIKNNIKEMCEKFYKRYSKTYGYENIVHFAVRFCIKHKLSVPFYYLGKMYMKHRG